ncbi:unnamed protein product [Cuscuta campestris]|uniref:DNA-directed RNA polymerases I, II, and III subunit RPABC3 n=2 Tax=Cuscuta sect. Cleistogrammica TaxID=1824901 RepID=A0A484KHE7_9ASTE|nr:hypothetical protein DM860_006492 [Cuscuta australis]VFQ62459.1 unnamed protein product [Cuscuta campestris]
MSNIVFDETFKIVGIDVDGKIYDKVSRIDAKGEDGITDMVLDINSEIYPVFVNKLYRMVLSRTLDLGGSDNHPEGKTISLADKFEYIMHGLLYKVAEESSKVAVYISFGGLQLKLCSAPLNMSKFKLDQRLFLLLRKI